MENNLELDQHFLIDEEVLEKTLLHSQLSKEDIVYEIGPGNGILTTRLLASPAKKVISVEKDSNLIKELKQLEKTCPQFTLIHGDGIEEIANHTFTKLIANIPYSITEPLYTQLLDNEISFAILLQGKKFYDLCFDKESKWSYFVQAFYDITLIQEVSGDSFVPYANTTSVLIELKLKTIENKQDKILKTLWKKRKRTVLNALMYTLVDIHTLSKSQAKEKIEQLNIDSKLLKKQLRNLSNDEFKIILDLI